MLVEGHRYIAWVVVETSYGSLYPFSSVGRHSWTIHDSAMIDHVPLLALPFLNRWSGATKPWPLQKSDLRL